MPNGDTSSVLKQKLARTRPPVDDGSPSIQKGLQLALTKAADSLHDLIVSASPLIEEKCNLLELQNKAKEDDLLFCLRGNDGVIGLVMLDLQLRAALIEVQTTGSVAKRAAADRPVTRTDAKLIEPTLKTVLEAFDNTFLPYKNRHWALGYRPSLMLEGPRLVGLVLEDVPYKVYSMEIDLDLGAKTGVITFAFVQERGDGAVLDQPSEQVPFARQLSDSVGEATIEIAAVLDRLSLPLSQIRTLEEGHVFFLDPNATSNVKIVATHGKTVATGELGLDRGHLAVRIASDEPAKARVQVEPLNGFIADPTAEKTTEHAASATVSSTIVEDPVLENAKGLEQDDLTDLPELEDLSMSSDFDFSTLEDLPELAG